ncbi:MAG: dicarboxylate/amino acid:cation symporter [Ignavibacteriaceae bacterium]|nr:dicarboxylate/amino acid:cation symporter [Ignavibacteriaceae bacterium]
MKLHTKIFIGLFFGAALGLLANFFISDKSTIEWIVNNISYPIGQIFLRLIFMVVIPLIFVAIVLGISDFRDIKKIGRIGIKALLFTFFITLLSVLIGIEMVNIFQPGLNIAETERAAVIQSLSGNQSVTGIITTAKESKSFVQILVDLIPRNPFAEIVFAFDPNYRGGGLLALMFFACIFGVAMALVDSKKVQALTSTFQGIYDVLMKIIDFAMKIAPIGVAALIFSSTSQLGFQVIALLLQYVLVVLGALIIHIVLTYGFIIKYFIKKNPLHFFKLISEVIITAFSTSSSNATLPTSIRVSIEELKIDKDVSNFVLTVGSTANQNGTALYEGITVLFLAQFYGIDLTISQQLVVVLLSILAGIGTAGVPGGSLPLVVIVLQTVGIPIEGIGIILGVDRILDMSRTVVNVTGDIILAAWIDESEKKNSLGLANLN